MLVSQVVGWIRFKVGGGEWWRQSLKGCSVSPIDRSHLRPQTLTFNADNMVPDLLGNQAVGHMLDQVVNRVDGRMDALEALDLLANRTRIVQVGLQMRPRIHHQITRN